MDYKTCEHSENVSISIFRCLLNNSEDYKRRTWVCKEACPLKYKS